MIVCGKGGCEFPPIWHVAPAALAPEWANYDAISGGVQACDAHLAEVCYFARQFGMTFDLTVKPSTE